MEKEEFAFSPLRPILFVIASPAVFYELYRYLRDLYWFNVAESVFVLIGVAMLLTLTWRELRITFLMLSQRPALVLTNESITITERNLVIRWTDLKDVHLANTGSSGGGITAPRVRYIILKVREPEKYIMTLKNPFSRYYRWYTKGLWNLSPFEVNLFLVRGDDDEIYHRVLRYYQNNRGF